MELFILNLRQRNGGDTWYLARVYSYEEGFCRTLSPLLLFFFAFFGAAVQDYRPVREFTYSAAFKISPANRINNRGQL